MAWSTNSLKVLIFDLPFTRITASSEARSAIGVKLVAVHAVLACSGVVMRLPLVEVMWYGLPFWAKT